MAKQLVVDEKLEKIAKGVDAIAEALSGSTPTLLDETFAAMLDGENTTAMFHRWWKLARAQDDTANRYATMCRFFEMLAEVWEEKVYTLRFADWRPGSSPVITPLADLAGKTAAGVYTETMQDAAEWCDEDPMTWYVRANALSLADGTMNVLAVEGLDDTFDISGYLAPVYTFRLSLWRIWYTDGVYEYKTFATRQHGGMKPYAADVAPDETHRVMSWHATFGGSLITKNDKTCLTSGSGNRPAWRVSGATGIGYARNISAYEGLFSDTDLEVILDQWQLRHWNLENSGILEGCLNYNYQYTVAAAEEGVRRVILTTAQAANLLTGSVVCVGSHPDGTNNDRNTAANYDIVPYALIESIESVMIDGTEYAAVNLAVDADITVPATGYVSTMPWLPGSTEHLPGHKDGSLHSCTDGKTPARIAGVEIIDGAYAVGLDPLWNSDWDETRTPKSIYSVYQCRDSENQAGSITANYELVDTFTGPNSGWQYIKHFRINDKGMMIPDGAGETGSGASAYLKSAFYFDASSGVRCPWRFCALRTGDHGGLAGAYGYITPSYANWYERPRLSGSGKKRGEWAA